VNFGASDAAMSDDQMAAVKNGVVLLPMTAGSIVLSYNLSGGPKELKLSREAYAGIFLGKITQWSDPVIAKANPGEKLPDTKITVVTRSDGSGTTFVFTSHLSAISEDWKKGPGAGTSVNFPVGVAGKGNPGVTALIKQTPGAIGYVELIYALQNKIPYGPVQNAAGEFVRSSIESVTAAAGAASKQMPPDFRVSITNAAGKGVYPISSFTWLLFYENPKDKAKAKVMVDFMKWALTDGQKYCKDLGYAPLPEGVVALEMEALKKIRL